MIINTGMRTDIPAFYPEWLDNRLKAGFVYTRNPYDPKQITEYRLTPDVVDAIVFCTKNPAPLFPYMERIKPYGQYWFVTITPYGTDIEPNVPPKEIVMESFRKLSRIVGADCMGWRYDPILITDTYTVECHIKAFERMAAGLAGYTRACVISFIDLYKKVKRNFPETREVKREERIELVSEFVKIAGRYDMIIRACAEGIEPERYGADCGGCMTREIFEKALRCRLRVPGKKPQRAECSCLMGNDIGAYDTCGHLCRYCYANTNAEAVMKNRKKHDAMSPLLTGVPGEADRIHRAEQKSWRDDQIYLNDLI